MDVIKTYKIFFLKQNYLFHLKNHLVDDLITLKVIKKQKDSFKSN